MRLLMVLLVAATAMAVSIFDAAKAETPNTPPATPTTQSGTIIATASTTADPSPQPMPDDDPQGDSDDSGGDQCIQIALSQTRIINGITHRLYFRDCTVSGREPFWVAETTPADLARNLWDQNVATVPAPSLNTAPPTNNTIVKLATWLWTDPAQWAPITAHASVRTLAGQLSTTVTAEPLRLVFDPNEPDSEPITCPGPGQPWLPAYDNNAESSCSYTYQHSSSINPTNTFASQWSIVWRVTWTSSTGASGVLDENFRTTTTQSITVQEVQAIVTE